MHCNAENTHLLYQEYDNIVVTAMSENLPTQSNNEDLKPKCKAIVIYDTRFGNTKKVAEALTRGIQKHNIEVKCVSVKDVELDKLGYDLIAIGAPTHFMTASKSMKEFLLRLEDSYNNFAVTHGFAFDTRYDSFFAGSSAKYIEKKLEKIGLQIIRPHSSAIVREVKQKVIEKGKGKIKSQTILREGMEESIEAVGSEIGKTLVYKPVPFTA
jgi:flavodoxin